MRQLGFWTLVGAIGFALLVTASGGFAAGGNGSVGEIVSLNSHKPDHEDKDKGQGNGNADNNGNGGQGAGNGNGGSQGGPPVDAGANGNGQGNGAANGNQGGQDPIEEPAAPAQDEPVEAAPVQEEPVDDAQAPVAGEDVQAAAAEEKVVVCHATTSETNPYRVIEVSINAMPAHEAHGDFAAGEEVESGADCAEAAAAAAATPDATPAAVLELS